jgi:hypothetical protein
MTEEETIPWGILWFSVFYLTGMYISLGLPNIAFILMVIGFVGILVWALTLSPKESEKSNV